MTRRSDTSIKLNLVEQLREMCAWLCIKISRLCLNHSIEPWPIYNEQYWLIIYDLYSERKLSVFTYDVSSIMI